MNSLASSARRVAETPELLFLITDFIGQHDHTSLLRVSHHMFACVVTSLWEDLKSATILLKLIPGVIITKPEGGDDLIINFPATIDLTRFNIYAPSVKQLSIISVHKPILRFGENAATFTSSPEAATLVPNLEKLEVAMHDTSGQEYARWVTIFSSPALLDVKLVYWDTGERLGLGSSTVLGLLENLSLKCPSLRRLDFFLREDNDGHEFETKSTPVSQQRLDMLASFRLQLSSFRDLCTLKSSILLLRLGILSALGELPHLETLSIDGNSREPRVLDLTLPSSSFPALRSLELWNLHWANLRYISEFVPLLHRLTKLSMIYDDSGYHRWNVDVESDWQLNLMRSVARNAPLITDLTVYLGSTGAGLRVSSSLLKTLQHLRLKRLSLLDIEFECSCSDFASALPHLEEFEATDLRFRAISQLAKGLPQLRLLRLSYIDLAYFGEDEEYGDDPEDNEDEDEENDAESDIEPVATCASKYQTAVGFSKADLQLHAESVGLPNTKLQIQEIARFFHKSRPNLKFIVNDGDREEVRETLDSLNGAMAALNV